MLLEVKNKKIFAIVIILVTIALIHFFYNVGQYEGFSSNRIGLEMFYNFNGCGIFLPFYILLGFLTNNIVSDNFYRYRKNKFQNFITVREGKKKRMIKEIKIVLLSSFIVRLLLHVIVFFIINEFFADINLKFIGDPSYYPEAFFAFSHNSVISFVFYILYSCIGFSIISLFLYSIIWIIKNQYVYKISGILVSIIFVLIPAFIGNMWLANAGPRCYFETGFLYLIYSAGLLSPGIEVLKVNSNMIINHLYFYIGIIGFLILSIVCIGISIRRGSQYD